METIPTGRHAENCQPPLGSSDEPDSSDGCDKHGFPGGCARAGHTPENCPGFQIGDTIRFAAHHIAAGDTGIIVGIERWLDDNETVVWDGCGREPAYSGVFLTPNIERFLVRLQEHNPKTKDSVIGGLDSWRERCLQWPHNYPFVVARDLELASRPEIKILNDPEWPGSALGREGPLTCVSGSEAGARKAIADAKVALVCLPLKRAGEEVTS